MTDDVSALLAAAQQGCSQATEQLLSANLNLVRSVVHRFSSRGYEWDDLFQVGCMGLLKAIARFNTDFGVQFSTYAVPMIIGEIRRFMRDDNPVKISRCIKETASRIHRSQEKLQGVLGREPTISEIAADLSMEPQDAAAVLEAMHPPASLYAKAFNASGDTVLLMDQLTCCDGQDSGYIETLNLHDVLQRLPEKEQNIIRLRFFADKTQAEIGGMLHMSQVQVSRLEKQAIKMLREFIR